MFRIMIAAFLQLGLVLSSAGAADAESVSGLIDRHIESRLDTAGIEWVAPADDATFLRRAFLDLHGVIPSAEQAATFLESRDPEKRAQLVEQLLASPRFGAHLGDVWQGYLISSLANEQRMQTERFGTWLADRFNNNDGWDRITFDLLTATGKMEDNPAVTYLIEGRLPLGVTDLTDLSSRYFLGIRLNCAQCHDHPFVEWKQEDYWGMAAFFSEIQTPGRPKMVYVIGVKDDSRITLDTLQQSDMLEGFQSQPPRFLGSDELKTGADRPLRVALARWITSSENPYFARAMVNRMWWHFFGRGLVNPVDDMHAGNVPSHPELLDELSRQFVESGFDLKLLCRGILNSRTYQQSSRPGDKPDKEAELFARMSPKVLSPEQLYDSLALCLGTPAKKTPSVNARFGARHEFTEFFRGDGDSEPARYERGIPHVLRLMNSPQFAGRNIQALVSRIMKSSRSPEDAVDELFLTILSRKPTPKDKELVEDHLRKTDGSLQTQLGELAWALVMTSEFTLNH